jgi:hypothetical protein
MDAAGLHINPLVFIAAMINLWVLLKRIQNLSPCVSGYIVDLLLDNTTQNPDVQPLARFTSALLVQASCLLTHVWPVHILGKVEADALSCFQNGRLRSWEDVINRCSCCLETCKICLLLPALLVMLAEHSLCKPAMDKYDNVATHLLSLAFNSLPAGLNNVSLLQGSMPPNCGFAQMIDLLGAFPTDVKNGNNLSHAKITGQTLRNYVNSATDCFLLLTSSPLQIYDIATLSQIIAYMHPYLQELISQRSKWTQPKPRTELCTYCMLANQASSLA